MVDTSVIANIERSATFLASSSLLIIAGLVTALGQTDKAMTLLSDLPLGEDVNRKVWELGILLLLLIYAYAFFTFHMVYERLSIEAPIAQTICTCRDLAVFGRFGPIPLASAHCAGSRRE